MSATGKSRILNVRNAVTDFWHSSSFKPDCLLRHPVQVSTPSLVAQHVAHQVCVLTRVHRSSMLTQTDRLLLNYRQLPYRTEWISYPDIKPLFQEIGFKPTAKEWDGGPMYTVPAIVDPTSPEKTLVENAVDVALYLEKAYPASEAHPGVFPEAAKDRVLELITQIDTTVGATIGALVLPSVPNALEDPIGAQWFTDIRHKRLGFPLEDLLPRGSDAREATWAAAKKALDNLDEVFAQGGGDYILGDKITYADFVLAALLGFAKDVPSTRDGPEVAFVWDLVEPLNGGRWARFMEKMEKYRYAN